jgi:5,10-methylenetetrahydrofolate reductase
MAFLRVVEVLPPLYPNSPGAADVDLKGTFKRFTKEVGEIRAVADYVLVASVKNQGLIRVDGVHAAIMLQESLGVKAAPVLVVRDQNRTQFLSAVVSALTAGLSSMMVAWGDDYPPSAGVSNVRDFPRLSDAIGETAKLFSRARIQGTIFAPVNVAKLGSSSEESRARERLRAGARLLLAQPPTADPAGLDKDLSILRKSHLEDRVLLGVFPFTGSEDVRRYEKLFGWKFARRLHDTAKRGEDAVLNLERDVVARMKEEGLPGVYLATRGRPALAKRVLS